MKNTSVPHLSGGIFFALVMEAIKPRRSGKSHLAGNEDPVSGPNTLEAIFKFVDKSFSVPKDEFKKESWRVSVNKYKSCKQCDGTDIVVVDKGKIEQFDKRVRANYEKALSEMKSFVSEFIDTESDEQKHKLLVNRLLYVIKYDSDITPASRFLYARSFILKDDLPKMKSLDLCKFLMAVWHYVVCNKIDNSAGAQTYDEWWPSKKEPAKAGEEKKRGGQKRAYIGPVKAIGECYCDVDYSGNSGFEYSIPGDEINNELRDDSDTAEADREQNNYFTDCTPKATANQVVHNPSVFNQYGNNNIQVCAVETLIINNA